MPTPSSSTSTGWRPTPGARRPTSKRASSRSSLAWPRTSPSRSRSKLAPYYSSFANFAGKIAASGVAGLVLFNRFYQPDFDPDSREVVPTIELSESWELRLPLRWVAIFRAQVDRSTSLAITSGVHSGADVAKALLVGADVAMMASAVLRQGPEHVATVERELLAWMEANDYESVSELRGSVSYSASDDPAAFERANYLRTLHSWTTPAAMTPGSPSAG